MVLSQLSRKYANLVLGKPKKESSNQMTWNCPLCGDKRGRGNLGAVKDEIGVYRCFNAGCVAEQGLPFPALLKMLDESLYQQYRKEKFNEDLGIIKPENNLNNLLEIAKNKKVETPKPVFNIKLPEVFGNLVKLMDVKEAVKYIENRCVSEEVYKNWYFSKEKFLKVLDKNYFVENFIFIPIIQNDKLKGFYTRSIEEKRFSTILFPNAEKYWSSTPSLSKEKYYIFEGIFDALSSGFDNVIAMLSSDLSEEVLENLIDPVFVFDNDKTGRKKSLSIVEKGYEVFVWPDKWDSFKDMNEVLCSGISKETIKETILSNIEGGFSAKVKLNLKKL
jgi:hypothetical protein